MTNLLENLPHRRMEAWKWTDVRGKASDNAKGMSSVLMPSFTVPDGVFVSEGDGHASDHVMGKLASKFAASAWNVYVPKDSSPEAPLVVENLTQGHVRIAIMVDAGASLRLIEHHRGNAGGFANIDMQIHLAEGASLHRVIFHDDPDDAVRVATACIATEKNTTIEQYALSFGAALSRLETRLYGEGEGIEATMNGAYLLGGTRHTDMTSHVQLAHPDCTIRQSVKGVVTDKSRGVFQGKFHVEQAAQHTDAEMRHDALMLSDTAEVRAKPELEIYADDVACAHGNTVGALDESALFYMRQRGIPVAKARAMLTEAFVVEVFDDLDDEAMKESLLQRVKTWLHDE